jgi:hypothetical protein
MSAEVVLGLDAVLTIDGAEIKNRQRPHRVA